LPTFTGSSLNSNIAAGLSTQVLIECDNQRVGAIQRFTPNQRREIRGIGEVGTDGFVEKVPSRPTQVTISVERLVFDLIRLPQAFARAFHNIHAQRVPFNINVYDVSAVPVSAQGADGGISTDPDSPATGILMQQYVDCWFSSLSTTYAANDYLISESADIEVTFIRTISDPGSTTFRSVNPFGSSDNYERVADRQRVGSLDAVGLSQVVNGPLT
jgi:hypothetical protein